VFPQEELQAWPSIQHRRRMHSASDSRRGRVSGTKGLHDESIQLAVGSFILGSVWRLKTACCF